MSVVLVSRAFDVAGHRFVIEAEFVAGCLDYRLFAVRAQEREKVHVATDALFGPRFVASQWVRHIRADFDLVQRRTPREAVERTLVSELEALNDALVRALQH